MSEYTNGLTIQIADMVFLDFREGTQNGNISISKLVMTYENLKSVQNTINQIVLDYDAKLAQNKKLSN